MFLPNGLSRALLLVIFITVPYLAGCAHYTAPGRGVNLGEFAPAAVTADQRKAGTDKSLQPEFEKKPLAKFPASVAVVRVQEPHYHSLTADGWGSGAFSVVTTRDVETDEQFERLSKLDKLRGIVPIRRLLLPSTFYSDLDLRTAAARLQADIVMIYTIDTTFTTEDQAAPLTFITLGLAPVQKTRVNTTISAIFLDTRNGYVYGAAEASERDDSHSTAWTSQTTIDNSRRQVEIKAFDKLVGEVEKTWKGIIREYTHAPAQANRTLCAK